MLTKVVTHLMFSISLCYLKRYERLRLLRSTTLRRLFAALLSGSKLPICDELLACSAKRLLEALIGLTRHNEISAEFAFQVFPETRLVGGPIFTGLTSESRQQEWKGRMANKNMGPASSSQHYSVIKDKLVST